MLDLATTVLGELWTLTFAVNCNSSFGIFRYCQETPDEQDISCQYGRKCFFSGDVWTPKSKDLLKLNFPHKQSLQSCNMTLFKLRVHQSLDCSVQSVFARLSEINRWEGERKSAFFQDSFFSCHNLPKHILCLPTFSLILAQWTQISPLSVLWSKKHPAYM